MTAMLELAAQMSMPSATHLKLVSYYMTHFHYKISNGMHPEFGN